MKITLVIVLFLSGLITVVAQPLKYPTTRKVDQVDDYFGTKVQDPYRWLEDDRSPETAAWVKEQDDVTFDYLAKIPFRNKVKERLTKLWNFPKSGSPFKGGKNYFVYTNDGLQNQFVLNIIRNGIGSKPEPFLDPNKLSADGTVNIANVAVSHDGNYLAYAASKAGSDWEDIYVIDTRTGNTFTNKVEWVKFSGISWKGNGYYYSRYDAPDSSNLLKGKNEMHRIYYHVAGNPQEDDQLVFEDKAHSQRNHYAQVTDDEKYLVISGNQGTSGNNLIIKNLSDPNASFKTLVDSFDYDHSVIGNENNMIYIHTNKDAPNNKIIIADAENPKTAWITIIPEEKNVLQNAVIGNNMIIAEYMKDATSLLKVYSMKGQFMYDIPLPGLGTVDQLSADPKSDQFFYAFTSFTEPSTIYRYNLNTQKQEVFFKPKMDFNSSDYETKQVFYSSKDGTKVPMFIVNKKGIKMDGNNPVLMFGYGGFNVSYTPQFKIERLAFLENGGVFVMPNLRGGGEYGETWHEAGTKLKKQNVFDDYIAAAEYLIKEKYTRPEKLAISGRSNGGLLVGAVMTQRPDLFKVAIPTVGVMDMLRFHKFTIGWAWKSDYGSSEDEAGFRNLYKFSPLHNIKEGINYPATLVTTGDHDDRVVPAHSFKFIATLQEKHKGPNPVLIRIDINAGHASTTALGSSKPVAKQIEEQTDIFSFIMYNLGMSVN